MKNSFENYLKESGLNRYFKGDESLNISLYHDLNIYGDIAEGYIELLRDKYNVDVSKFKFENHFPTEFIGDSFFENLLYSVVPFLRVKYNAKKNFKPLTFDTIKKALKNYNLEE